VDGGGDGVGGGLQLRLGLLLRLGRLLLRLGLRLLPGLGGRGDRGEGQRPGRRRQRTADGQPGGPPRSEGLVRGRPSRTRGAGARRRGPDCSDLAVPVRDESCAPGACPRLGLLAPAAWAATIPKRLLFTLLNAPLPGWSPTPT